MAHVNGLSVTRQDKEKLEKDTDKEWAHVSTLEVNKEHTKAMHHSSKTGYKNCSSVLGSLERGTEVKGFISWFRCFVDVMKFKDYQESVNWWQLLVALRMAASHKKLTDPVLRLRARK